MSHALRHSGWDADKGNSRATMRYFDRHFAKEAVKLLPGEYFTTHENIALVTVLGSCVSACIRDRQLRIGGMNHFMLPEAEGAAIASARYGSYAMELLLNELLKAGARRETLEAKLFGGGHVLRHMPSNPVGRRNIEFVRNYLHTEHIHVIGEDLGHDYARKVCYMPFSGQAFMRRVDISNVGEELASERAYGQRLKARPVAGDIELFN